jgi:eukaryotic-like serine/threonine-protein kinase
MPVLPPDPPMTCEHRLLVLYLDSDMSVEQRSAIESHLDDCRECRQAMEVLAANPEFWEHASRALETQSEAVLPRRSFANLSLGSLEALVYQENSHGFPSDWTRLDIGTELDKDPLQMLAGWLEPSPNSQSLGRIGKYEVQGIAGQGGMGLVLKAYDTELHRPVALKTLANHIMVRGDARSRLAREARAVAALSHPHVISIFGLEAWRDVPLIVMPLVEGGTLQQYASQHALTTMEILTAALQIASALSALHASGVVHRDLKPSNILLQDGLGHLLLSDFGLARFEGDQAITHSDALAGTPYFMSPEQSLGKTIDFRSDLFSLGSVLYWLCCGQYPFRGDSNYETLSRLVHSELDLKPLVQKQVPDYLQRLIHRLLSKSPAERWASAEHVVGLLNGCLEHCRSVDNPLPTELKASLPQPPRVVAWLPSLAIAMVGLLALTVFGIHWRADQKTNPVEVESVTPPTIGEATEAAGDPMLLASGHSRPYGRLDELDRRALLHDIDNQYNLLYWLRRLAYLSADEIPAEVLPKVQVLAHHGDPTARELSQVILNKNPFQEVSAADQAPMPAVPSLPRDENPFQEVLPNE